MQISKIQIIEHEKYTEGSYNQLDGRKDESLRASFREDQWETYARFGKQSTEEHLRDGPIIDRQQELRRVVIEMTKIKIGKKSFLERIKSNERMPYFYHEKISASTHAQRNIPRPLRVKYLIYSN